MSIVVEEEKGGVGMGKIIAWIIILVIIGASAYYVFFAKPELIEITAPSNFKIINPLAKINLNPEEVVNSPDFQALKQYIGVPVAGNTGRANPFLAP